MNRTGTAPCGKRDARSTPTTDGRAIPGSPLDLAPGNGMMTPDMDRLLTAPGRPGPRNGSPQGAANGRTGTAQSAGGARLDTAQSAGGAPRLDTARTAAFGTPGGPRPTRRAGAGPAGAAAGSYPYQQTGRHGVPMRPPPAAATAPPTRPGPGRVPGPNLVRRMVLGVLVGALTMFGVATLDTFAGATVPVLGSFASLAAPAGGSDVVEVPAPPATPGTCLMWSRSDAADTAAVDCAQPHLFEQAGSVTLTDQNTLPDDRQWRQIVNDRCAPLVEEYLGGKFDPDGRYRVGALKPSAKKWDEGDRELRCGVQSASRSGALYPLAGKASGSDQSPVQQPGTCLAIDGRTIGDPVDCGGPHAVETVGIVDLSDKFPDKFPAVGDQDAFLQPECGRIANDYSGGSDVIADKKLTVYWDNLTEESWSAGTRKVNCNLAALLPDRSGFAPVSGPVRGDVVVGDTPAPPAGNTPSPGSPAPSSTAPAPPADDDGPDQDQPPAEDPPADEQPTETDQPPADENPGDPGDDEDTPPTTVEQPEKPDVPATPTPPLLPDPAGE